MTDTAPAWKLERDAEGIAWLTLDKPNTSANVLSAAVLAELNEHLARLERELPRGLVLISAKKSGFIAGADIREFTGIRDEASGYTLIRRGQQVFDRLEALPCPSVAAIHGFALGGGLETALACRYRVGVADERLSLGLPEVQLGLHPGFGGTVRTVRLIGVRAAMELMLTGRPVRAQQALKLGLLDRLVPAPELRAAARELIMVILNGNFRGRSSFFRLQVPFAVYYTPAIISYQIMLAGYSSLLIAVTTERERGMLKRLRGTPMPSWIFLAGEIMRTVVVVAVTVAVLVAVGARCASWCRPRRSRTAPGCPR